jgi:hypothetical protein
MVKHKINFMFQYLKEYLNYEEDIDELNKTNIINGAPIIQNIFDFLASDFMEL